MLMEMFLGRTSCESLFDEHPGLFIVDFIVIAVSWQGI